MQKNLKNTNEKDFNSRYTSLQVTSLSLEDLEECVKLDLLTLKGLWSKSQWEIELSDSSRICKGIFYSSNLIAFACAWIIVDELHLTALAVHPEHRRNGLGYKILSKLFKEGKKKGCQKATLEVKSQNKAALCLYRSLGFNTAGTRNDYYKSGEDALIQWIFFNEPGKTRERGS